LSALTILLDLHFAFDDGLRFALHYLRLAIWQSKGGSQERPIYRKRYQEACAKDYGQQHPACDGGCKRRSTRHDPSYLDTP
jgi:hypothetical protein